jgi:MoaA/NifB/PqqE/SkfB family radical SAM enzyme
MLNRWMMNPEVKAKRYRVNGLSFREDLRGETLPFGERVVYLGLNGVLQPCNWSCMYCLEGIPEQRLKAGVLGLDEQLRIIEESSEYGARGLLITGGEPFSPDRVDETRALVRRGYKRGLVPLVYTNCSYLTEDLAKELADNGASVALKMDSLIPERYDRIAGREGAYYSTMKALERLRSTSVGDVAEESDSDVLVRLLFTTVGNALNADEYVSIARFATNHGARWMMETLNLRGDASNHPDLQLDPAKHSGAMGLALALNPEQQHDIEKQQYCRLFYMVSVNTATGEFGVCPQDYGYLGNIRGVPFEEAASKVLEKVNDPDFLETWKGGLCPIKEVGACH